MTGAVNGGQKEDRIELAFDFLPDLNIPSEHWEDFERWIGEKLNSIYADRGIQF